MKINFRFAKDISANTLMRLPDYLNYLELLQKQDVQYVSSKNIAEAMHLNDVQVRKDLSAISSKRGVPKKGFDVNILTESIRIYLGCDNLHAAVLIGAGRLGAALMSYKGFDVYGLNIVAAFDKDPSLCDTELGGKPIYSMDKLEDYCLNNNIYMAIIAAPAECAQTICDRLIENGILAIWNFAPTHINVPENILLYNENLAASLAMLSNQLQAKLNGDTVY